MAIDARELERLGRGSPGLIDHDRPCRSCGYNLRGLPKRGSCPECGTAVKVNRRATRFTDNLADAPLPYLRMLVVGLWTMTLCGIGGAGVISSMLFSPTWEAAGLGAMLGAAWAIGVWIVTSPRQMADHTISDAVLDSRWLRRALRGTNALWPLSALMWMIGARLMASSLVGGPTAPSADAARVLMSSGLLAAGIAMLSIVPLGIFMASLADWAGDGPLATRVRSAVWVMAVGVLFGVVSRLASVAGLCLAGVLKVVAIFMGLMAVGAAAVLIVSLLQFAHVASWAISNHHSAEEIARRRQMEVEAHEAKLAQRSIGATPPLSPAPRAPGPGGRARAPSPAASAPSEKAAGKGPMPTKPGTSSAAAKPTHRPAAREASGGAVGRDGVPFFLQSRDARLDPPMGEAGAEPYDLAPDDPQPPKA